MRRLFERVFELAWPYRFRLTLGVIFGVLCGLAAPLLMIVVKIAVSVIFPTENDVPLFQQLEAAPQFVQDLVNRVATYLPQTGAEVSTAGLLCIIVCIPLAMALKGVCSYINIYMMQWVGIRSLMDLRNRLFSHFLNHSVSFLSKGNTGEFMSRIINDTYCIQSAITSVVPTFVRDPITIIGLASYLLWNYFTLTLITLVVFPLCVIPVVIYAQKMRRATRATQTALAQINKIMYEAFSGNRIVKAYNLENLLSQKFYDNSQKQVTLSIRSMRAREMPSILIEIMGAFGAALVLIYIKIMGQMEMSPADFMTFIGSFFLMYQPIKSLSKTYSTIVQATAASDRVFQLLEIRSEIKDPIHPKPLNARNAEICFENLFFGYGEGNVLSGINLTIKPGQKIALVGHTGSGKSTIIHLLLRFFDPTTGRITIGGTDIRDVTTHDLREQTAVVTQDTFLFSDTIRNNIAHGKPNASFEEIQRAAKLALAEEFILEKPDGYDSLVGERGVMLSGGQRQRIAIARALLRDAPILLLDEATSALDTKSERVVQTALETLMQGRTSICVAHRLSTIYDADLIVVLDHGHIMESGTHQELLDKNGIYRRLYDLQFTQLN